MAIRPDDVDVWEIAAMRESAVRRLVALPASERTRKAVAEEAERIGVSTATMFRLLAAWRSEPVRSTLVPVRRGPKRGLTRAPEAKRKIIRSSIEQFYARREAPRMSDLVDEIAARCRAADLVPPVWATVKRYISAYDQRRLLQKREGRVAADEVFAITSGLVDVLISP